MEEIRFQQINAPRPMTGKSFLLGVAAVLLRLAIAQILCNLLITATGVGLLNIAFYLYAVVTLFRFMRKTVAGSAYTLKEKSLVLQKRLGDSTTSVMEIPLDEIVSVRPICAGERLKVCYKQVTVMDANAAIPMRIRWGWRASLLSAHLARKIAGNGVDAQLGYAIVYHEEGDAYRRACVFCPDEQMCAALADALGSRFGMDDRLSRPKVLTMYAQALQRAFPELYAHVTPLVSEEQAQQAAQEIARQKAEHHVLHEQHEQKEEKPRKNDGASEKRRRNRSQS